MFSLHSGCVVSSAYLAIEPKADHFGDTQMMKQTHMESQASVESEGTKSLAPNFVRVCSDRDTQEGKMTRFDCRVTGRPYPDVTWYINGRPVSDDATHKILVNESGNHALMITNVSRNDHGVVTCIAKNKAGETSFQVIIPNKFGSSITRAIFFPHLLICFFLDYSAS